MLFFFFLTAKSVQIVGEGEAGVAVAFGWMMLQIWGKKEPQVFKDMGQKAAPWGCRKVCTGLQGAEGWLPPSMGLGSPAVGQLRDKVGLWRRDTEQGTAFVGQKRPRFAQPCPGVHKETIAAWKNA